MAATEWDTELRDAAERLARARGEFVSAVRHAHADGMSLREIAAAAGISHETVRRLVGNADQYR